MAFVFAVYIHLVFFGYKNIIYSLQWICIALRMLEAKKVLRQHLNFKT